MHHSKVNVHFKSTLGNKTDNQTPLVMQGKVQNITNKQKNEILKQEEWKEGKLFPCTERQMSWNMTSKTANTNSDKSQAKFAKDPEDSQNIMQWMCQLTWTWGNLWSHISKQCYSVWSVPFLLPYMSRSSDGESRKKEVNDGEKVVETNKKIEI